MQPMSGQAAGSFGAGLLGGYIVGAVLALAGLAVLLLLVAMFSRDSAYERFTETLETTIPRLVRGIRKRPARPPAAQRGRQRPPRHAGPAP